MTGRQSRQSGQQMDVGSWNAAADDEATEAMPADCERVIEDGKLAAAWAKEYM